MIPQDERGYSILGGEVHTRYADHATAGRKVRTVIGLLNVGGAAELSPCPRCYPPPPVVKPRSRKPEVEIVKPSPEVEAMAPDDIEAFPRDRRLGDTVAPKVED